MSEFSYGDKIFKLLQGLERKVNVPDLHSFVADIANNGKVYVCARVDGIFITHTIGDKSEQWVGSSVAASNRLEMLGLKLDTVDI